MADAPCSPSYPLDIILGQNSALKMTGGLLTAPQIPRSKLLCKECSLKYLLTDDRHMKHKNRHWPHEVWEHLFQCHKVSSFVNVGYDYRVTLIL
jgi:hypothetical protein